MGWNALAFLRRVLPDSGWYCAWTKAGERSYNTLFSSVEDLANHIQVENAQGRTVYHACASFMDTRGAWNERTQKHEPRGRANAWRAKSLWLDIDANKPDSPYATAMDAVKALGVFCSNAGLGMRPLVVGSGYGIHAYWPLSESLAPDVWQQYANGLKGACQHFAFRCDPVRTADICSVLRTPGTENRKHVPALPVAVVGSVDIGPYDVGQFDFLLAYASPAGIAGAQRPVVGSASLRGATPLTRALIVEPEYAPVTADDIANRCAQLAHVRGTRGCVPEPLWYAALGVLSRCVDGAEKAHEWSSGYQGYTARETQAKFDRTLSLTGATTCAKFESVSPGGCDACPLKGRIVSPITAGSGRGSAHSGPAPQLFSSGIEAVYQPDDDASLPLLPAPFAWNQQSQLVCVTERGEDSAEVLISNYPIYLVGVGVGEVRNDKFGLHFRQWHPFRGWTTMHIAAGQLMGASGSSELAGRGANIHDFKLFVSYVRAAIDSFNATHELKMQYDQCGWKNDTDAFLAGDALYSSSGVEENVTVSQELGVRAQWIGPQSGTLEGWSGAANALFATGCEPQSFALMASFAAPLMRFQASDEGGAVVNLLSRGSGTGKTTALSAVYTAWGRKQGLSITKIDTRVSKAITLGVLGNLPVVYDEIHDRDPEVVREFIMMFTNGRDKMRGHGDGTILHQQAMWQTLLITASNLSLHDMLATHGTDALSFRVLEFVCKLPEGVTPSRGDRLRKDMEANAGHAGDAYLAYLMQPDVLAWTKQALESWTAELWNKHGNRPEHRFWVRAVGAVAVASTLVNSAGILEFKPQRIVDWAMDHIWRIGETGNPTEESKRRALDTFGQFLNEHIDAVLVVRDAFQPGARMKDIPIIQPNRRLFMRHELQSGMLYISRRCFTDWLMDKGVGSREMLDELSQIGLCKERNKYVTLTAGTSLPSVQQACVVIDAHHPAVSGRLAVIQPEIVQDNVVR